MKTYSWNPERSEIKLRTSKKIDFKEYSLAKTSKAGIMTATNNLKELREIYVRKIGFSTASLAGNHEYYS